MAGDWIKIEHSLPGKPEVMEMARLLSIDEMTVVGHLVCFWSWVDQNLSPECPAAQGTKRGLDRVSGRDGFVDAMVSVGWLTFDGHTVTIPNYDHHLSESGKKRAVEARKKQRQRKLSPKCPADNGTNEGQNRGLEKRREEKSIKPTTSIVQSREVLVPEKMQTPEVQQRAAMWFAHLDVSHPEKRPLPESPQMQAFWEVASRLGPERFCDAVLFSVSSGFANLREQSETKQGHTQQSGPRRNRNGKIIQEMPKEW